MTVINTNVGALMAKTYAARANSRMTTSMERLSSGLRINSAADDAAGLAVANKMKSQLSGMNMAMRNSLDGISLVQTAESGMTEITNMILRMRELAVQMDNGVYTGTDRDNAQLEVNALLAEIDKIASNTRFNDVTLLDGTYDQTIRAGNTNAETIRIAINSLFTKDNGSGSNISNVRSHSELPASGTVADYNIDPADLLKLQLGISATSSSSLSSTDSQKVLSDIVSAADFQSQGDNLLLLKDDVNGLGYMYAAVKLTDQQWARVSSNLLQTRGLIEESQGLDPSNTLRASQIQTSLQQLEVERSQYIGAQFHANQIKENSIFVGAGLTNSNYAEILNVYSDPETRQSVVGEVAAVEIEFVELAKTLHDPRACEHCQALAASNGSGAAFGSGGVNENGEFAFAQPNHTQSGSGYAAVASPSSSAVSPLVKGAKWNSPGTDADHGNLTNALTYSYWDGTSPYNYTEGTRTTVESHGAGNQAAHDNVFSLWDAVSPFSIDKVTEDGDGDPVGDLRVAFTDGVPAGSAAFAYYPSSTATGGDIYYSTRIDTNGNAVDFVDGEYNWVTAIHEVGHALGLSHPFDGGSKDGSTLNLNLDFQRNTVMTYVQRDRNYTLSYNNVTGAASIGTTHTSTPGLLDIEAIEAIYGSAGWDYNNGNDNVYGGGADGFVALNNNYEGIRTIVDSGGTGDTLDASGVTATGSIINLTPGTYSSINYYATQADKINAVVTNGSQAAKDWFTAQLANLDALASASNSYYTAYTREALYRGQDNVGIAHNTWIENAKGGSGADTITGNAKGNEITGNGGNDTIDGGAGTDVAIFAGNKGTYTISQSGSTVTVAGGADGTDTLTNVEFLKFDDGVWSIADAVAGNAATHANIAAANITGTETGGKTGGVAYGEGATNIGNLALKDIKVQTKSDSQNAVTILNRSLEQISSGRAKLGAIMNRLQHNIDNQTKGAMMSQQARGRIVDSDMAIESTKLAQEMILARAAQQAINMASQRQLTVLALLET
ncbi:flagellin [Alphaproteobacteria bacterium LSUCC0226]